MMRKCCGTSNASTELVFTDNENKEYTVQWSLRRAHYKAEGRLQKVERTLLMPNGDKKDRGEVDEEIQRLFNLTFEQFCRTTMLAQGDFTRFLKSKDEEKSEILEQLTGLDIYSKISQKIYEIMKEKRSAYEYEKINLESVQLLNEEECKDLVRRQENIGNEKEKLAVQEKVIKAKTNWFAEEEEITKSEYDARKNLQQAEEKMKSKDFVEEGKTIQRWNSAHEALNAMKSLNDETQDVIKKQKEFEGIMRKGNEFYPSLKKLHSQIETDKQRLDELNKYLVENEKHAAMLNDHGVVCQQLNAALQRRDDVAENAKKQKVAKEKLPVLQNVVKEKEDKCRELEETLNDWGKKKEELETQLTSMQPDNILSETNKNNGLKNMLTQLRSAKETLSDQEKTCDEKVKVLKEFERQTAQLTTAAEETEAAAGKADSAYKTVKAGYEIALQAAGQSAKEMRQRLKKGDKCPVCGAVVGDIHEETFFQEMRDRLEEQQNKKFEEWQNAQKAKQEAKSKVEQNEKDIDRVKHELTETQQKCQEQYEVVKGLCRKVGININELQSDSSRYPITALSNAIDDKMKVVDDKEKELKKKNDEVTALRNKIKEVSDEQDKIQKSLNQAKDDLQKAIKEKTDVENKITSLSDMIKRDENDIADTLSQLGEKITYEGWMERFQSDAQDLIDSIRKQGEDYVKNKNQAPELSHKLEKDEASEKKGNDIVVLLNKRAKEVSDPSGSVMIIDENVTEARTIDPDMDNKWDGLRSNCESIVSFISDRRGRIAGFRKKLDDFYAVHTDISEEMLTALLPLTDEVIQEMRNRQETVKGAVAQAKGQMDSIAERRKKHDDAKPAMEEGDTKESLQVTAEGIKAQVDGFNQELGGINEKLKKDEEARQKFANLQKILKEKETDYGKWDAFNKDFGSEDGKKFRNIAQSFILSEMLGMANDYLKLFTRGRFTLSCQPGSLSILVEDSFSGAQPLSASTLSGGESFMVSLSLALALAAMNDSKSSIDTLFIDEGFGTLDVECLDTVLSCLDVIHQRGGKKVGIISHVEELKNRIPAKVQVERVDKTKSKVVVKME